MIIGKGYITAEIFIGAKWVKRRYKQKSIDRIRMEIERWRVINGKMVNVSNKGIHLLDQKRTTCFIQFHDGRPDQVYKSLIIH